MTNLLSGIVKIGEKLGIDKRKKITNDCLISVLKPLLAEDGNIIILDKKYRLFSEKEVTLASITLFSLDGYVEDFFDCDNYAIALMAGIQKRLIGCPFGIALIKNKNQNHAVNIFLDDKLNINIIDPQTFKKIDINTANIYFILI